MRKYEFVLMQNFQNGHTDVIRSTAHTNNTVAVW